MDLRGDFVWLATEIYLNIFVETHHKNVCQTVLCTIFLTSSQYIKHSYLPEVGRTHGPKRQKSQKLIEKNPGLNLYVAISNDTFQRHTGVHIRTGQKYEWLVHFFFYFVPCRTGPVLFSPKICRSSHFSYQYLWFLLSEN